MFIQNLNFTLKIFLRIFAILLLLFLGFGGIYGGWILISDPSGGKFDWSLELLEGTPFRSFLIPGIILFMVNGLLPLAIAIMTISRAKYYEWLTIIQGCILIGWLTSEVLFSKELFVPGIHILWYGVGLLLILNGVILLRLTPNARN